MKYKFSFSCDSDIVGYCMDVRGLNAETVIEYKDKKCNEIELVDFYVCDEYLRKMNESKLFIEEECSIDVLNNDGRSIGSYDFFVRKRIKYNDLNQVENGKNLSLLAPLSSVAVGNEIKIWDMWRESRPKAINEWVSLNDEDRIAWGNITRKYRSSEKWHNDERYENVVGGVYHIDGSNITTFESFFCALGEAMNGPGGYYGFDHLNLIDCLTGGFRVCRPFKLIWKNSSVAMKSLTKEEWENYGRRRVKMYNKIFQDYSYRKRNRSFFSEILEIFIEYGVTVVLEP